MSDSHFGEYIMNELEAALKSEVSLNASGPAA